MNVFSSTFVDPKALRLVDVKEGERQNKVCRGDAFFTISSEAPEEVGMSSVLRKGIDDCYLNSFCASFRFSESTKPNPVFTGYMLRQSRIRGYFAKKAQGSTRVNLSKDAFKKLPIFFPSFTEQQKIANCQSSLDELIAGQARKVDALKTHEKRADAAALSLGAGGGGMSDLILYTIEDGKSQIQLRADLGLVWLTQLEMAELFDATKKNISLHCQRRWNIDPVGQFSVGGNIQQIKMT